MAIEVFIANEQSDQDVDEFGLGALAKAVLIDEGLQPDVELSLLFVDEATIAHLNEQFLAHVGPTDVLSFPIEDEPMLQFMKTTARNESGPLLLGDVVVCPAVAARNAPEHAGSYEDEMRLLVVHGILHVLGMDHVIDEQAEVMEARERELLGRHVRQVEPS